MKILLLSGSSVYVKGHKRSEKNNSGFAHMMNNISSLYAQENHDVSVISQTVYSKGIEMNGWNLLPKKFYNIIFSLKPRYIALALKMFFLTDSSFMFKMRTILYSLTGSYVESLIKKNNYDIVHIHGIGEGSLPYIIACDRCNIPYVITLHGLHSFSNTTKATNFAKSLERNMFKGAIQSNMLISIVSTGAKFRVESWLHQNLENLRVINNPVEQNYKEDEIKPSSISIKDNFKNIICVGNISKRKNQIFVLKTFEYLLMNYKRKISLTFIGGGHDLKILKDYCKFNQIKNVHFTGMIPKDEVNKHYINADLLVSASLDEGFGLPFIEAYTFGVPGVCFDDIDAIEDIYNESVMIKVNSKTIEEFGKCIIEALSKDWNKKKIKDFSKNFSEKRISLQYNNLMIEALSNKSRISDVDKMIKRSIKEIDLWKKV